MISTEKAFDMLPYVADIYEKVDIKSYVKKKNKKIKSKQTKKDITEEDMTDFGLDMFAYIIRQSPKVKKEFFEIVAIIEDKKVEEVKKQNFGKTIKTIKGLYEDAETMDFFKSAVK
jgi:hypothetical protein